jgi:hypothetical protein
LPLYNKHGDDSNSVLYSAAISIQDFYRDQYRLSLVVVSSDLMFNAFKKESGSPFDLRYPNLSFCLCARTGTLDVFHRSPSNTITSNTMIHHIDRPNAKTSLHHGQRQLEYDHIFDKVSESPFISCYPIGQQRIPSCGRARSPVLPDDKRSHDTICHLHNGITFPHPRTVTRTYHHANHHANARPLDL